MNLNQQQKHSAYKITERLRGKISYNNNDEVNSYAVCFGSLYRVLSTIEITI